MFKKSTNNSMKETSYGKSNTNNISIVDLQKQRQKENQKVSTKNQNILLPNIQREYRKNDRKRYSQNDLRDNKDEGSLWNANLGQNQFLFSKNDFKSAGDIIIVKVNKKLKDKITEKLQRIFNKKRKGERSNSSTKQKEDQDAPKDKVYDQIPSLVIDVINKKHLLIKGRKNLLYKGRQRAVELEALIAKRDLEENDTINSNNIIESSLKIFRN